MVGFLPVQPSDPDPLLRCLDRLLKTIYTRKGVKKQIRLAYKNASEQFSLVNLRRFLANIERVVVKGSGLGLLADTVLSIFDYLTEAASKLDASVELPPLREDTFRQILNLLRGAFPTAKFVFILDNLNAPTESGKSESDSRAAGLNIIKSFLSTDFETTDNVYFCFSWTPTTENSGTFSMLRSLLSQHGGEEMYLKPIKSKDDIARWLDNDFAWFTQLSVADRHRVVSFTEGLPSVVVRWREQAINSFDPKLLDEKAREVRQSKYSQLQNQILSAPEFERVLLYELAIVGQPLAIQSLADMNEAPYESCLKLMQKWSRENLLLVCQEAENKDQRDVYNYDHESKRNLATSWLPKDLPNATEIAKRTYHYLLKNSGSGLPWLQNLLGSALYLASTANFQVPSGERAALRQIYHMHRTYERPADANFDPELIKSLPLNWRADYFGLSLHCKFDELHVIRAAAYSLVPDLDSSPPKAETEALALATFRRKIAASE